MPKKIIIVRHGETDYNVRSVIQGHLDIPLNKKGMEQAEVAAEVLKKETIDVFFSSDLQRALITAKKTARHHNKEIVVTASLRERSFGKLEGMETKKIIELIPTFTMEQNFSIPDNVKMKYDIETDSALKTRISEFVKKVRVHNEKTIAIFSHGGLIRNLLLEFGVPFDVIKMMRIKNASPIILEKKESGYVLITF